MLRPSYSELMDILNKDADLDIKINSRYSIVIAAAKRARQIINGDSSDIAGVSSDKAVSIAIHEMEAGLIKIYPEGIDEPVRLSEKNKPKPAEKMLDFASDEDEDDKDEFFEGEPPVPETAGAYVEDYNYEDDYSREYLSDYDDGYTGSEDDYSGGGEDF